MPPFLVYINYTIKINICQAYLSYVKVEISGFLVAKSLGG